MADAIDIKDVSGRVQITSLGARGDGLYGDGAVRLSLPGDVIEGGVLVAPSPHRVSPLCPHFGSCGGCVTQHASDMFLAEWKSGIVAQALRAQGLPDTISGIHTSPPNSRRRVALSGRRTKKTVQLGFFARGTNLLTPINTCDVLAPQIADAFEDLRQIVRLAASRSSTVRLSVTVAQNGLDLAVDDAREMDATIGQALPALASRFVRVAWNGEVSLQREPPLVRFGTAMVPLPLGAFLQATSDGEEALVALVRKGVGDAQRIVDLYCGCGTFTLPLAKTARIHGVEAEAQMVEALEAGWRNADGLKHISVEARNLAARPLLAIELNAYEAIVLDPPRAGASAQVEQIAASSVARVVHVSCNPATFARDARVLTDAGFALDWVQVVDQFRWSTHIELVGCFSR